MKVHARTCVGVALLGATPIAPSHAQAANQPPPPCSSAEHRALDFWVGEWRAEWDLSGHKATGTNVITRDEYGDCVITERFRYDDGSFRGFSVSTYRAAERQWRQTWMDDQGGYFDLVGGPTKGAGHDFMLENKRIGESAPFRRMIFQDVRWDSFTWRWQGRNSADEPWVYNWVIRYSRKPGSMAR